VATTDVTAESLEAWREAEFARLGFPEPWPKVLARSRDFASGWPICVHQARKLVESGCSHDTALRILL
jgi:hypothetical protein